MFDLKKTGAIENVAGPLKEDTVNCLSTEKPRHRRDALAVGGSAAGLRPVGALWARMCADTREDGSVIKPNDPGWSDLRGAAEAARPRPRARKEQRGTYGTLVEESGFVDAFEEWLGEIGSEGAATAPDQHLRDG